MTLKYVHAKFHAKFQKKNIHACEAAAGAKLG